MKSKISRGKNVSGSTETPPALMPTKATLCFVVKGPKILLIKKKRGIGAGKLNGPGGRLEKGETFRKAAIRETMEEVGIIPINPKKIGRNFFYADGKIDWIVDVFHAEKFSGNLKETEEAVPKWVPVSNIPYGKMWPDDKHWMPLLLKKRKFAGRFHFDGKYKKLIKHDIKLK